MNRTRPKVARRPVPDRRQDRPSTKALAVRLLVLEEYEARLWAEYEGLVPHSDEWRVVLSKVKAAHDEAHALNWRILSAVGYSVRTWRKLRRRA